MVKIVKQNFKDNAQTTSTKSFLILSYLQ